MKKILIFWILLSIYIFGYAQPSNDAPCGAINIPVSAGNEFEEPCVPSANYTWVGATANGYDGLSCGLYGLPVNVWYKFTVPASGAFIISTAPISGTDPGTFLGGYQIALIGSDRCVNPSALSYYCSNYFQNGNLNFPTVTIRNQTPGSTQFLAVWRQGGLADGGLKLCINEISGITAGTQRVGIGIATPRKNFDVNGSMHVQGDFTTLGRIGIGTTDPQYPFDITGRIRLKAKTLNTQESAGIWLNRQDNSTAAVFFGMANDTTIGFYGNYGSDWNGFTMNSKTGLTSMGLGAKMSYHLGRLVIRQDPAMGLNDYAGTWLHSYNNTPTSFIGLQNNNSVGFFGANGAGWGLTMNNNNGNVNVNGQMGIGLNGATPAKPLSFPASLGEKILLYPGGAGEVGIGVYGNELRIHADNPGAKVSFGTQDNAGVFTENALAQRNGAYAFSILGNLWVNGTTYASDARFKQNISAIESPLKKLLQLKGVEYEMKTSEFQKYYFTAGRQIGLIAQDVEKIVPEAVHEKDGYKGVDYARLVPLLIESIKELKQENDQQKKRIEAIEQTLLKH